ncbi:hypothetical protein GCM10011316_17410 [Roseibium aquae]|uniref:DUF2169 domain-containing protein n=1 Tax=Roseibium aquae TaxID=1323746 RepID=A0A916TJ34_9HYPH|nr:DUF2169 domain-containing protein [Roseibium aquae]GGB45825.1 hypothetical protein GCM10011316_17410 [Roseibium aquae]
MPAIVKPTRVSAAYVTEPVRGGAHTTVSAHVLFDLAEPGRLLTEQALWPMVAEQLPNGAVFDKGQLKPKAEVLVAGCALSPSDTPVEATQVTLRFGALTKSLAVFGDRVWRLTDRGIEMSRPVPFLKMPIGDVQAFGGQNYAANRRGKGHGARALVDAGYDAPLPNIEDPRALIRSVDDCPAPAHFGPLPADDARRLTYLGTYDEAWIKSVSPCKPDDFNPLYHCEAPEDQRLDAFFQGGETFSVSGMSCGAPAVGGTIPRLRGRCFYFNLAENALIETQMRCDTITLFPNVEKATMTFRALVRGQDRFAEDISAVMVALEDAGAPPRDPSYYADVYARRTSKDEAHKYALADFQLMPERDAAEISARRKAKLEKAKADRDRFLANQNWGLRKTLEDQGLPANLLPPPDDSVIDDIPLVGIPTAEEIENGDLDLAELLEDMKVLQDALTERQNRELAQAELQRRAIVASLPAGMMSGDVSREIVDDAHLARYADIELDPSVKDALEAASRGLDQAKTGATFPPAEEIGNPEAVDHLKAALQSAFDDLDNGSSEGPDVIETHYRKAVARALGLPEGSILHDARQTLNVLDLSAIDQIDKGPERPPGAMNDTFAALVGEAGRAEPAVGPDGGSPETLTRAGILTDDPLVSEESKAKTKELADQLEAALRDMNMPFVTRDDGADVLGDLMGVIGEIETAGKADLEGLSPSQAARKTMDDGRIRFDEAETQIAESLKVARQQSPAAIFPMEALPEGVPDRLGAFVRDERAKGHTFKGADLAGAQLQGIDFSGCDLRDTFFEQCDLTGANFARTNLSGAVFTGACLDKANLSDADLSKANLSGVRMLEANLDRATLDDLVVIRSDFSGTKATGAVLSMVRFIECTLDRTAFTESEIRDLQLISGSALDLSMRASRVERAVFVTVSLGSANFAQSDLERIGFTEIQAPGSTFAGARMLSVGFMGNSDLTASDFSEISAQDSSWNTAQMAESCFLRARCNSVFFNTCQLEATDFRLGSFHNTLFGKSVLRDSDFFGAHLYGASLTQTDLRRCSMRNANLYAANLLEAKLASCDFTGANLALTLLEQPTHA